MAAHELAHQFLRACCEMDSDPLALSIHNPDPTIPDPDARGTYNAGGGLGTDDTSPWVGYWPNPRIGLHWENVPDGNNPSAEQDLENCLRTGWYKTQDYCSTVPYP